MGNQAIRNRRQREALELRTAEQIQTATQQFQDKLALCKQQFEAIAKGTGTKESLKQIAIDALKMWDTDEQGTDENTSTDEQGTDENTQSDT